MKHTLTQLVLALVLALALTPPKALASVSIQGGTVEAVQALVGRILPTAGDADKFQLSITPSTSGKESFSLQCDGSTVSINATGGIALATGVNWYLNHYAGIDISWNSPTAQLPAQLPACALETHEAKVDMRYYLNFCTHSYTMSFWGWDRWQQELDWMALRGINAPLLTVGFEAVYRELLMNHYGLTLAQVSQFVAGPAFYGWFYMDNLTGHGGPVTENWYNDRQQLGTQIFQRAHELGMEPVVPGCLGMVPQGFISNSMAKKNVTGWTTTNIAASGSWQGFTRPALVVGETQMKEYAAAYYQAIETVFDGQCQTRFYALDPFHEGGNTTAATNVCGSVLNFNKYLLQALQTYKADAIWVAQHWQSNPTTDLTRAVPAGKLIILNLHSDRWGESDCSGQNSDASGQKHMWVYGMLNNYGGNVGLFSCMGKMISSLNAALLKKNATNMVGLGAIPEGTENNETSYDVLYSSAWATGSYTLESWTQQWVKQRYGLQPGTDSFETMNRAWLRLMKGPLSCTSNQQQGTTESVFMMRPGNQPGTVSSWAYSSWYWDLDEVKAAAVEFIDLADELGENTNYQYDLVDLVRQCLADEGYRRLSTYSSLSGQAKTTFQQEFLQMILDQDALLGTHPMFRLGRWIEMARALGHTDDEKRLMEENARLQVTTWIKANNALHDYGNREWNGLLASYYYPRWKAYFDGGDSNPGWYANYEVPFWQADTSKPWYQKLPQGAKSAYGTFTAQAEGQPVEVARQMMQKYFSGFQVNYFEPFTPLTGSKYQLRNVNAWKFAAGTEGITVAPPNNDYSAGYRLQRKQLVETDNHFEWQFEPGSAEGTYKMKNVGVAADATNSHYGAYLTTNVSSSGYQALTLSTADNAADWRIFTKGEGDEQQWYIVSADGGTFFAPDVQWNEACVLKGTSRTQNSMLRLVRVQHEGCVDLHYTVADAQGHTVYQTTFYDQTVGEAYPQLTMADGQGYTSSTYYTLTGMPTTNITAEGTQVALSIAYTSQMPFEPSPSFEEGKWYNMTIGTADASKTRQLNYRPGDEVMTLTRTTTQGCDPQDMWCFVGNPFEGYQVYNRLAGATRLLSGPLQNANNQTAALLAQPLPDGYNSRWFIQPSTNGGTNGFYLGQQGHANNRVNVNYTESFKDKLIFWTGGANDASTCQATPIADGLTFVHYLITDEPGALLHDTILINQTIGQTYPNPAGLSSTSYYTLAGLPTGQMTRNQNDFTLVYSPHFPFEASRTPEEATHWYNVTIGTAAGQSRLLRYHADNAAYMPLTQTTNEQNSPKYRWCFVGDAFTGFRLYNKEAGTDRVLAGPKAVTDQATPTLKTLPLAAAQSGAWFAEVSTADATGFFLGIEGTHANRLNVNTENAAIKDKLMFWTGGAGTGSTLKVTEVDDNDIITQAQIDQALKDEGVVGGISFEQADQIRALVAEQGLTAASTPALRAAIEALKTNRLQLKDGQIYTIESDWVGFTDDQRRVVYETPDHLMAWKLMDRKELGALWRFTSTTTPPADATAAAKADNPSGRYYTIQAVNSGRYLNTDKANGSMWLKQYKTFEEPYAGNFLRSETLAHDADVYVYEIRTPNVVDDWAMCLNGPTLAAATVGHPDATATEGVITSYRSDDDAQHANVFMLREVRSVDVALNLVNSKGYATTYLPVNAQPDEGTQAYYGYRSADEEVVVYPSPDGNICHEQGALLVSEAGNALATLTLTEEALQPGQNVLEGTTQAIQNPGNCYVLSTGASGLGFYHYTGTQLGANRAYIPQPEGAGPLRMVFGPVPTGISALLTTAGKADVFDLQGRRLQPAAARHGIYISQGRKVIIK